MFDSIEIDILFYLFFQPPTEKLHQIIARTAMFVSKHGGQCEIVLRVKQGDNPTFGFLMPDHHLHSYFRFLVDNSDLLSEENKNESGLDQASGIGGGGALSLLGSVYGSGEDEDGGAEDTPELKRNESGSASDSVNAAISKGSKQTELPGDMARKDEKVSRHSLPSSKEKAPLIKRNQSISAVKVRTSSGTKKEGDLASLCPAADKLQASASPSMPKVELPVVEPPSDMKRAVDKIVEFILRNGKEFETILVEQDRTYGRFPFLLPSNLYYPYYLKVLHKSEESKLPGKGSSSDRHDSTGLGVDKKKAISKESDMLSLGSDIPYDSDKKEKFKMVISKSKKDGQEQPSKVTQPNVGVTMDAAAAAAILQAATRGIRNPNLDILSKTSLNGSSQGPSSEGGQASQPQSSKQLLDQKGKPSIPVPVANAIAKSAAIAAASEADSSEASLTEEQKLKAERLKRAKVFAAMIKGKAAPSKDETLRGLSVEPPDSGFSGSGAEFANLLGKEREGSSVPVDVDTFDKNENIEMKDTGEDSERRSKRKYRSRSNRDVEEEEEEEEKEENDHKRSKKKQHYRRSSHHSRDRKRHSSSKDRDSRHRHSRHRHKQHKSSDDESQQSKDLQKRDSSCDNEHHHSLSRHKHGCSSDDEHHRRRHRSKHKYSSSDEEHRHRSKGHKHRKRSHSEREVDLEEGEIKSDQSKASNINARSRETSVDISKSYHASREPSVDLSKSNHDGRASSQPSNSTNEVPDDLRAKIRAMLMATL
ncbi:splicing factor, suppressor of white-apricot homolog isoform X2 [Pistacia vera]|uniref:splicing factor, suppressor of white-apricot homolog isoform X2 n=1 Tax=Pistacia vera TaxID=55513 RepID=UPI001262BA6A|nr:splicing factor, suppressor of white-apricot homolog isoform X2 [Pistacia vera]XP_031284509.1 splicing factor, suppressor of white-apricot homolog isoform X2 [Pistacia vera]XP_031284510.1 splicing factor, suppressor of white-apricot homolog isoform X2 [Pistacia vera]XP_031284511.1 splicing factor, suppressor of white-apricot homolog isoform X2 [Pistacia vera]